MRKTSSIVLCAVIAVSSLLEAREFAGFSRLRDPDKATHFGWSVAISGDTLVVGDRDFTSGTVWIFERQRANPQEWELAKRLSSPIPEDESYFGWRVRIDHDVLLVGVGFFDSVMIFSRNHGGPGNWGFVKKIADSGYMALDGELVAVSFYNRVKLHQRNLGGPDNWGRLTTLRSRGTSVPWAFDVDLSGTTLVVGGVEPSCATFADFCSDGYRIFEQDPGSPSTWQRVLHVPGFGRGDTTGHLVVADGPAILSSDGIRERGRGDWRLVTPLPNAQIDLLHTLRQNTVIVERSGKLVVLEREGGGEPRWIPVAEFKQSDSNCREVALGPRELVVGCPQAPFGTVKIYPRKPIFAESFESLDLSAWHRKKRKVRLVSPGLGGSEQGLAVVLDGGRRKSFVRTERLEGQPSVSLDFTLLPNRARLGGETIDLVHLSGAGRRQARVTLRKADSDYLVELWAGQRGADPVRVGGTPVPSDSETRLRIDWERATGSLAANGSARLLREGELIAERRDLSNARMYVSFLTVGLPAGSAGTERGTIIFDNVALHR